MGAITAAEILSLAAAIISATEAIVSTATKLAPELLAAYEQFKTLYESYVKGEEISEEQVQALRERIDILNASNAAAEDAIINAPEEGPQE